MAAIPDVDVTLAAAKNFISEFLSDDFVDLNKMDLDVRHNAVITQEGRPDGLSFCDMKGEHYD